MLRDDLFRYSLKRQAQVGQSRSGGQSQLGGGKVRYGRYVWLRCGCFDGLGRAEQGLADTVG